MTREEGIKILIRLKDRINFEVTDAQKKMDALNMAIKALEQEQLTDKEIRIFLAAMSREENVCKKIDDSIPCREPYEDTLVSVCKSIERKVKKALWE